MGDVAHDQTTCRLCLNVARLGWLGTSRLLHCDECGATWTGVNRQHCTVCHETFSGPNAADKHNPRGACKAPESVGLHRNEKGIWCRPGPPTTRVPARAAR